MKIGLKKEVSINIFDILIFVMYAILSVFIVIADIEPPYCFILIIIILIMQSICVLYGYKIGRDDDKTDKNNV